MQQKGNLKGTYRTLDGMDGDTQTQTWVADTKKGDKLKLEDGLLATDGWTLIDDSQGLLFDDNKDWDWVKERPANGGQDWYFIAYGHDYKAALKIIPSLREKYHYLPVCIWLLVVTLLVIF